MSHKIAQCLTSVNTMSLNVSSNCSVAIASPDLWGLATRQKTDKSGNYKELSKPEGILSFTIKAVSIRQAKLKQSLNRSEQTYNGQQVATMHLRRKRRS